MHSNFYTSKYTWTPFNVELVLAHALRFYYLLNANSQLVNLIHTSFVQLKSNLLGLATLNHGNKLRLQWQKVCLVDIDSSMLSLDVIKSMRNQCHLFRSMNLKVCGKVNDTDNINSLKL